jgi:hypothetical protein
MALLSARAARTVKANIYALLSEGDLARFKRLARKILAPCSEAQGLTFDYGALSKNPWRGRLLWPEKRPVKSDAFAFLHCKHD